MFKSFMLLVKSSRFSVYADKWTYGLDFHFKLGFFLLVAQIRLMFILVSQILIIFILVPQII